MTDFQVGDIVRVANVGGKLDNSWVDTHHIVEETEFHERWPILTQPIDDGLDSAAWKNDELELMYREGQELV